MLINTASGELQFQRNGARNSGLGYAYDSNFCFDIWCVTNADYLLLTYLHNTGILVMPTDNMTLVTVTLSAAVWPQFATKLTACIDYTFVI